ncbi:Uncharacterised protein [Mycobacteroides abscessus subsp. abscessus]|nr:Uncharacterised protein [Mycobacteroides abscessus subsp. abscessus]
MSAHPAFKVGDFVTDIKTGRVAVVDTVGPVPHKSSPEWRVYQLSDGRSRREYQLTRTKNGSPA